MAETEEYRLSQEALLRKLSWDWSVTEVAGVRMDGEEVVFLMAPKGATEAETRPESPAPTEARDLHCPHCAATFTVRWGIPTWRWWDACASYVFCRVCARIFNRKGHA
jgi:hypothetical protein